MQSNPVGWFEIYVNDMKRAQKFYEGVLNISLQALPGTEFEMLAFPGSQTMYGAPGALVQMPGCSAGGNSVLIYFSSADCAIEEKRIVEMGGTIHRSKFSIGQYGFIVLAMDSEGNMFGVHSRA